MKFLLVSFLTLASAFAQANCTAETTEISNRIRSEIETKCEGVDLENRNIFYRLTNKKLKKCLIAKTSLLRVTEVGNALLGYQDALQEVTRMTIEAEYLRKINQIYVFTQFDQNGHPSNGLCKNYYQSLVMTTDADVEFALKRYAQDSKGCTEILEGFSGSNFNFLDNFYDMAEKNAYERLAARKDVSLCH